VALQNRVLRRHQRARRWAKRVSRVRHRRVKPRQIRQPQVRTTSCQILLRACPGPRYAGAFF